MSESTKKLLRPKKKRRVRTAHRAPFPVPIRSITLDKQHTGKWFHYSGQLVGSCVMVKQSGDIHYLNTMGFFGKGNLSRGGQDYRSSFSSTSVTDPGLKSLRVIKRQSYIRHLNWQKEQTGQQSGAPGNESTHIDEYDSSQERGQTTGICERGADAINETGEKEIRNDWPRREDIHCDWTNKEGLTSGGDWSSSVKQEENISAEELWDSQEADRDVWLSKNIPKDKDPWGDDAEVDYDFWGTETKNIDSNQVDQLDTRSTQEIVDDASKKSKNDDDNFWSDSSSKQCKLCKRTRQEFESFPVQSSISALDSDKTESNNQIEVSEVINISDDSKNRTNFAVKSCDIIGVEENEKAGPGFVDSFSNCDTIKSCRTRLDEPQENVNMGNFPDDNITVVESAASADIPMKQTDPLCGEHEEGGDVLVVSDSDDDGIRMLNSTMWKRVMKQDPYKMEENLQLSLEEAFFLSYGLGCLVCLNHRQEPMNLCEMWQTFSELRQNFIPNYIAYHHFRSKGWVPKPGVKYGTDFILYKEGPPFYHATYSVVVRTVDDQTLRDDPTYISRSLTWTSLSGLNRITENVAKEVLFCFVITPSVPKLDVFSSPKCIPQFKVQEMAVKRWVAAQEREDKIQEGIP